MKKIELEQWEPFLGDPRRMQYAGQRVAQEVFEELKHRLEGMGYPFPADRSGGSALRHPLRNLTAQCVRRGAVLPRRLHFRQRHAGVPKIHRGYAEQL